MSKIVIDVSDRSINVYFDTNIYDRILDDPEKQQINERIKEKRLIIMPSVVNLCELLMARPPDRKIELIRIFQEIKDDFHPLKPYDWLLKESVENIQGGIDEIEVNYPRPINKETENSCRDLFSHKGSGLEPYLNGARDFVQEAKRGEQLPNELQFFEIIDSENGRKNLIELFRQICTSMDVMCGLGEDKIKAIITSPSLPWKFYLESHVYLFYRRAFLNSGYGKHSNPDPSDLQQCVYLFWASKFITENGNFFEFLKDLKKIRNYEIEIMNYSDFKSWLLS